MTLADGKRRAGTSAKAKTSKTTDEPTTWKQRARTIAKWGGIGTLVMILLFSVLFFIAYRSIDIPSANEDFTTQTTHVYYSNGEDELGSFAIQKRDPIDLDEMPETLKDAVVAAEDQSFWTNEGIDPRGILRAAFSNASGGVTQGASTITQQYVKVLYLTQERSWKRKVKEAILSLKVENQLSKEEVLEGYLNTIYFGRGAYGVQAAAQAYFEVDAKDLTLKQSAVLASLLNDPNDLDPANGKDAKAELKGRYQYVINSMQDMDEIDATQHDRAYDKLPQFPEVDTEETYGRQKGHVLQMVKSELLEMGFSEEEINGGGLEVTTTFTEKAMDAAEEGMKAVRPPGFGYKDLHVAVATVEPGTGAVRGIYAGQDYLVSQINWAVAGGQAGSTFKPFALAAGIKAGFSLKDTFDGNSPFTTESGYSPTNQDDRDYGRVNLITATESSVNTAFVDLTTSIPDGPQQVVDTAVDMGIPPAETPKKNAWGFPTHSLGLQANEQVALGSQTVSPINMANGYATIASGGVAAEPYIIEKVVDQNGETRYDHKVQDHRALPEDIAADVSYAMEQVVETGTGAAAMSGFAWPAAGKTGTATKDGGAVSSAWYAGFTAQYSTAVMYVRGVGNGQLDGWLPEFYGGAYPADTWRQVMDRVMEGEDAIPLAEPVYVDGDAPVEGHEPYTPPPSPTRTKETEEPETTEPTTEEPTTEPPTSEPPTSEPPTTPTDPTTPVDSDGDGLSDDEEEQIGTNPQDGDTDDDGIGDGGDPDPLDPDIPGGQANGQQRSTGPDGTVRRRAGRRTRVG